MPTKSMKSEAPEAQRYYVVEKSEKGWNLVCSIEFKTTIEAEEWIVANYKGKTAPHISRKLPGDVGHGFTTLRPEDLLK